MCAPHTARSPARPARRFARHGPLPCTPRHADPHATRLAPAVSRRTWRTHRNRTVTPSFLGAQSRRRSSPTAALSHPRTPPTPQYGGGGVFLDSGEVTMHDSAITGCSTVVRANHGPFPCPSWRAGSRATQPRLATASHGYHHGELANALQQTVALPSRGELKMAPPISHSRPDSPSDPLERSLRKRRSLQLCSHIRHSLSLHSHIRLSRPLLRGALALIALWSVPYITLLPPTPQADSEGVFVRGGNVTMHSSSISGCIASVRASRPILLPALHTRAQSRRAECMSSEYRSLSARSPACPRRTPKPRG